MQRGDQLDIAPFPLADRQIVTGEQVGLDIELDAFQARVCRRVAVVRGICAGARGE
jgi:hypothetical protein